MKTIITGCLLLMCFLGCKKTPTLQTKELNNSVEKKENFIKKTGQIKFSVFVLNTDNDGRPSKLKIEIFKNNKPKQNIIFAPNFWTFTEDSFKINQINYFKNGLKIQEGIENYHNLIIADFNFDNLEDFAILYDSGGNGGPVYSYYFQDKMGKFNLNDKFPLNQGPFPKNINNTNHTLTISLPISCCKIETTIFNLKENGEWEMISSKQEDLK